MKSLKKYAWGLLMFRVHVVCDAIFVFEPLQLSQCVLYSKPSLPNDLSEFRESEPIGICKNINSIHDQGRGYLYLEDRRSKRGFPPTLRKTT